MSGFCRWYEKNMEDLTEHEQESCSENGQDCLACPDLVVKEEVYGEGSLVFEEG